MKPYLVFIYADGCPACEMAKPELAKFRQRHPHVLVQGIDLVKQPWPDGGWAPQATPTYLVRFANRQPVGHEGMLDANQLVNFVRIGAEKLGMASPV